MVLGTKYRRYRYALWNALIYLKQNDELRLEFIRIKINEDICQNNVFLI